MSSLTNGSAKKQRQLHLATKTAMVKKLQYHKFCASQVERRSDDSSFVQIEHNGKIYTYKKRNNKKTRVSGGGVTGTGCVGNSAKLNYKRACDRPPMTVAKRNARERRRVHTVNQTFALLKSMIPSLKQRTKRVSKLRILQACIEHMDKLMLTLTHSGTYRHGNAAEYNRDLEEDHRQQSQASPLPLQSVPSLPLQGVSIVASQALYGTGAGTTGYYPQYDQQTVPFEQHTPYAPLTVCRIGEQMFYQQVAVQPSMAVALPAPAVVGHSAIATYPADHWF